MAITVNRKELSTALSAAQSCIEVKGTIPALAFALFEAKGGSVQITATDLDVSLITSIDCEGDDCTFCVPAQQLARIVSLLAGENVSFDYKEKAGRVQVTCGTAKHLLPSMEPERYPQIETAEGKHLIVKGSALAAMLERTVFAITDEESRYAMRGVYLETKEAKLIAVGTDGYRLAQVKYSVPFSDSVSAIVPPRAVRAIMKAFSGDDPVTIRFAEDKIQAEQYRTKIVARTVIGQYPKYEMIIPKERKHTFTLNENAVTIMKRAALTAREGAANNSPEIFFDVSRTGVVISSQHSEKGESEDRLEAQCETLNGDTVRLGVASKQVLEFMAHEPEIQFSFDSNDTSFRMTPTGLRDYEYVYVSMPVRL